MQFTIEGVVWFIIIIILTTFSLNLLECSITRIIQYILGLL